jgi:predicted lipid-binding transport protein (Tim44 family)
MNDSFDVPTIIFAALALFVVWKLRSVLGARTGTETKPDPMARPGRPAGPGPGANDEGNVVRLPGGAAPRSGPTAAATAAPRARDENRWDSFAAKGSKVWDGLDEAVAADPAFDPLTFLNGAKAAYEMIITAFAKGDRQTLRNLLAKEVFDSFSQALTDRETQGNKVDTTFVSIDKAEITDVQMRGKMLQIAVAFNSKLITATFDRDNKVIDGNPDKVVDVGDLWTFAHDTSSRDPNWALIAT